MTNRAMTKERIAVMQAFIEGKPIDLYADGALVVRGITNPQWDWANCDYRIRPTPIEGYARVIESDRSDKPVRFGTFYADKASCEAMARALGGRVAKFREVIEENN